MNSLLPPLIISQSGHLSTLVLKISRSRRVSLQWCRLAHYVARPMRMPAHISNNSWNSAVHLLSRESLRMQSDFDCFRFLFCGEQNSGFMPTEVQWTHGKNAPRHSSPNSSQWEKPTLFKEESPASSRCLMSESLKHRTGFRSTSSHVLTTGWIIGLFFRISTMG
jgi:hypothetical protein